MNNSSRADISAFESLQADQHNRTGMSSMAVFNVDLKELQEAGDKIFNVIKTTEKMIKQATRDLKAAQKVFVELGKANRDEMANLKPDDPKYKELKEAKKLYERLWDKREALFHDSNLQLNYSTWI
ncbi:MAG: hypothetical protein LBT09_08235 [Planctomycetaceae bacterium]|jgi:hypothetical protein|nr:hypothetical protein [Planctomycetaceae bacterium]